VQQPTCRRFCRHAALLDHSRLHSASVIISRTAADYSLVAAINLWCHCFTVVIGVATINLLCYSFTVVVGMATGDDHAGAQGILERRDGVLQDDVAAASALPCVVRQVVLYPHVVPAPETAQIINAIIRLLVEMMMHLKKLQNMYNMHEI
jgi:hypothetical protein